MHCSSPSQQLNVMVDLTPNKGDATVARAPCHCMFHWCYSSLYPLGRESRLLPRSLVVGSLLLPSRPPCDATVWHLHGLLVVGLMCFNNTLSLSRELICTRLVQSHMRHSGDDAIWCCHWPLHCLSFTNSLNTLISWADCFRQTALELYYYIQSRRATASVPGCGLASPLAM